MSHLSGGSLNPSIGWNHPCGTSFERGEPLMGTFVKEEGWRRKLSL
jgi:hypothetical protein